MKIFLDFFWPLSILKEEEGVSLGLKANEEKDAFAINRILNEY